MALNRHTLVKRRNTLPQRTAVSPDLAKRFAAEYLLDLNATQAYMRATGVTNERTAATNGWRLLRNADIAAAIQAGTRRQIQTTELTAARVLEELRRLAFFDPAELFDEHGHIKPLKDMTPEARAVIAGIEVARANFDRTDGKRSNEWLHKIKLSPKVNALEMLAKYFKLLDRDAEQEGGDVEKFIARISRARKRLADSKKK